jgi:hypothetical protein
MRGVVQPDHVPDRPVNLVTSDAENRLKKPS